MLKKISNLYPQLTDERIAEIRKKFYKKILKLRYEIILKLSYEELTKRKEIERIEKQ